MNDPRTSPELWGVRLLETAELGKVIVYEAPLLTQDQRRRTDTLRFGEAVRIMGWQGDYALVSNLGAYTYLGWLRCDQFARAEATPSSRIYTQHAPVYREPDIKAEAFQYLPLYAQIEGKIHDEKFFRLEGGGGFLHRSNLEDPKLQPFEYAKRFLGVPYLWGGKTAMGIDCSGLTQISYALAGIELPRDTDMQENILCEISKDELQANDLVFWKGHVGIMIDRLHLLHATAFVMQTFIEPLEVTLARVGVATSFRRVV